MDTVTTDLVLSWLRTVDERVREHADELTRLDSAIGDGDHGSNLHRGFVAVTAALTRSSPSAPGEALTLAGRTLISTVGGASGPLYGSALRAAGKTLDGVEPMPGELLQALTAGLEAVRKLGGAVPGDKTMVDAFTPAVEAFAAALRAGSGLPAASAAAADAAEKGARSTIPLTARKGRASYLGERSQGHEDPGAVSTALVFRALADAAAD
ncbi:dihydroxyacetone kinase subunit L [Nocardiopsis ansamitocini]|uniref:Dihydroxyacetone kinase subunit L n=2 Tax=Nocardiopsis ansamitocini TaxID=1670832 RepID=A0A9W6P767_9ACTN|nr:dihydroxyacetone kinase subunit L [Nocardiopsis ansamitocini]